MQATAQLAAQKEEAGEVVSEKGMCKEAGAGQHTQAADGGGVCSASS